MKKDGKACQRDLKSTVPRAGEEMVRVMCIDLSVFVCMCMYQCIRFRLVQTVNTMPNLIIHKLQTHSLYGFSAYAKTYFITNYEHSCNITDCYVCNRFII